MKDQVTRIIETEFTSSSELIAFNQKVLKEYPEFNRTVRVSQVRLPNGKYQFTMNGIKGEVEKYIELLYR